MIFHVTRSSSELGTGTCGLDLRRSGGEFRKRHLNHSRNCHAKKLHLQKFWCLLQTSLHIAFGRSLDCRRGKCNGPEAMQPARLVRGLEPMPGCLDSLLGPLPISLVLKYVMRGFLPGLLKTKNRFHFFVFKWKNMGMV